jgi:hypothetical protein
MRHRPPMQSASGGQQILPQQLVQVECMLKQGPAIHDSLVMRSIS